MQSHRNTVYMYTSTRVVITLRIQALIPWMDRPHADGMVHEVEMLFFLEIDGYRTL